MLSTTDLANFGLFASPERKLVFACFPVDLNKLCTYPNRLSLLERLEYLQGFFELLCLDLIINDGWYEQPDTPSENWKFHRGKFSKERGGAQVFAYDVDGDGDKDVISASTL